MYIKEYQIGPKLSDDVIGSTYLANTTDLEKAVYFRVLHSSYVKMTDLVQMFHQCAEKLCAIQSTDSIQALEHGYDGETHYIIFEYFKLSPLEQILQKKSLLHIVDAVNLIDRIAAILRHCHAAGRVHGVLTPQCIFMDDELENVSVSDFGFETLIRSLIQRNEPKLETSLPYFSPELIRGREIDHRSDIYSLGVLFYRLITGALPWPELSYRDYLDQTPKMTAIPPSLQRLEIPELIDGILLEMLEADPNKRCQTLDQFKEVFKRVKTAILASITPIMPPKAAAESPAPVAVPMAQNSSPDPVYAPESTLTRSPDGQHEVEEVRDEVAVGDTAEFAGKFDDASTENGQPQPLSESPKGAMVNTESVVRPTPAEPLNNGSSGHAKVVTLKSGNQAMQSNVNTSQRVKQSSAPQIKPLPTPAKNNKPIARRVTSGVASKTTPPKTAPKRPPAEDDDDFCAFTETQTEEFATKTLNIRLSWKGNRAAPLLIKFVALPLALFLCFYVVISFFSFEWARNLPNFRNSILFTKIQALIQEGKGQEVASGMGQNRDESNSLDSNGLLPQNIRSDESAESATDSTGPMAPDSELENQIKQLLGDSKPSRPETSTPETQPDGNVVTLRVFVHSGPQPVPADVYVNDKRLGRTNSQGLITISNLIVQNSYVIKVVNGGFSEWNKEMSFQAGGPASLDVDLNLSASPLLNQVARDTQRGSVTVLLSNALILNNAFVYVDGRSWDGPEKMAPTRLSLSTGRHTLEIRKDGFRCDPPTHTIDLGAGENLTVSFRMIPQ